MKSKIILIIILVSFFSSIYGFWKYNDIQSPKEEVSKVKKEEKRADKPDGFYNYFQLIKTGGSPENQYPRNYRFKELQEAKLMAQTARFETEELIAVERGPSNVGGRTRTIIIDYEDNTKKTWFAGSVGGGIWKTENAGENWKNITEGLPNLAISCMVQSPSNPQIIYAGTGEGFGNFGSPIGNGVFKTTDKGLTWEQLKSTSENTDFNYINDIIIHPKNQNILILATQTGIFKTENAGQNWAQVYVSDNSVEDLVFHPDNFDELYASVNSEGILKSLDEGKTWKNPILNPVNSLHLPNRIALAISPQNPNKIYASTEISSSESGLFVSEDAGINWTKLSISTNFNNFLSSLGWYANVISVNPIDENEVFFGGVNLFKTRLKDTYKTGSKTLLAVQRNETKSFLDFVRVTSFSEWSKRLNINNINSAISVEVRFGKDKKQKAHRFTVPEGRTNGVADSDYEFQDLVDVPFEVWDITNNRQLAFSFRDQGRDGEFNLIAQNTSSEIATEHSREYFYIHSIDYQENINENIAKNGGQMFQNIYEMWTVLPENRTWNPENLPETTFQIAYESPTLRECITQNVSDAYNEFSGINRDLHPDHHHLTLIPNGETFSILNGNDGGIALSEDGGKTFKERVTNYNTVQFYGVDKKPNEDIYIGGAQDNGTLQSSNNTNYNRVQGGDGFETIWHATDPTKILATIYNNQIYRSQNGGSSWNTANGSIADKNDDAKSSFMTRLGYSTLAPDVVFAVGKSGVWRSENFGISWRRITISNNWDYKTDSNSEGSVQTLQVRASEASPNYVWAGAGMTEFTQLHVSTDGGQNFRAVKNAPNFEAPISELYPHPTDSMTVFALFSVAGKSKILRSQDLGENWEDLSRFESQKSTNGFPDVAVYSMLVFPQNQNKIWAGTEIGIFESMDEGKSWYYLQNFVPASPIWDMKIKDNQVIIATHGRGIWSANMIDNEEVTNIENPKLQNETLSIFPNPNHGKFKIKLPVSLLNQKLKITIFDVSGKKIFEKNRVGEELILLDLKKISKGVYTIQILGKSQKLDTKLIIQ